MCIFKIFPSFADHLDFMSLNVFTSMKRTITSLLTHQLIAMIELTTVTYAIKMRVAMPKTTWLSRQALSGERQLAVSGNALDHPAIRPGPQW